MRNRRVGNVCFISRVEENDRVVGFGVIDELFQSLFRGHCSRRIVGVAQIQQIDFMVGQGGCKIVLGGNGQVDQTRITTSVIRSPGSARHDIGVDIDGIDRVSHADHVSRTENIENVSGITLRTVRNEDFVSRDLSSATGEIILSDCVPQKVVALLRTITAKRFPFRHFVRSTVHGVDNR